MDADVKEKLCEDEEAMKSLIELAKEGKAGEGIIFLKKFKNLQEIKLFNSLLDCTYGIVTLLVNVCNAYEKEEIMPEMLELAKFAKHHIPQDHELDDPDFVDKRIYVSPAAPQLKMY